MDTNTATAPAPINSQPVRPAPMNIGNATNPTAIRYGWGMFGDIDLVGGSGSINLHVQPSQLQVGDEIVPNPYHRRLPAKQLIPFPSFSYITETPSLDKRDSRGRPMLEPASHLLPALDAIILVMQRYGEWGFTMLTSLEGMEDQEKAFRIFTVVQPLAYSMKDMMVELDSGYQTRRDRTEPFEMATGYIVQPLRDDGERQIADALAAEMLAAAEISFGFATDILSKSETSIVTRLSGGVGKTGPDPLDRRLMLELGTSLPTVQSIHGGTPAEVDLTELKQDVRSLVDHAEMQAMREELAKYRAGATSNGATMPPTEPVAEDPKPDAGPTICGHIKDNGEPCRTPTKGGPCAAHRDK